MQKVLIAICIGLSLMAAVACGRGGHQRQSIHFARLERIMFDTPEAELSQALSDFNREHATPLLHIYPDDDRFMSFVYEFRNNDSVARCLDEAVRRSFGNLEWLELELGDALSKLHEMDEDISFVNFVTYIGNEGYANRVKADRDSKSLVVVIDQYVVSQMQRFGYFGDPLYLIRLCDSAHLVSDCVEEAVRQFVATPNGDQTLLDYMVAEGKVQYLMEQALPDTPDSIRLRYTDRQLHWMQQNEVNVWGYFIQNQLLYVSDYSQIHNFVDDAPKTNVFVNSAPRTVSYIGWHIVRQYMKNYKCSVKELLENTDSQRILVDSGYRPD
ncbi:MAG: hypothetical protein KBT04_01195 [Bacteroidales bacterium]|nr:hypothetical protein [Candidatus Colimorpha onthohippi]